MGAQDDVEARLASLFELHTLRWQEEDGQPGVAYRWLEPKRARRVSPARPPLAGNP